MKKFSWLFVLIGIVVVIFGGKKIIDKSTFDYKPLVDDALNAYYVSNDVGDLKPITDYIDTLGNDDNVTNVQNYAFKGISDWYLYMDKKYVCDIRNKSACKLQLKEFIALNTKLENLITLKASKGSTIILPSSYNELLNTGRKKIKGLEIMVNNPSIKDPADSEQIRDDKCKKSVDCVDCRDGICKCTYIDGQRQREELLCRK